MTTIFKGRFLNIFICLELILSPLVIAQDSGNSNKKQERSDARTERKQQREERVRNPINLSQGVKLASQLYGMINQNGGGSVPAYRVPELEKQMEPLPDEYFNSAKLSQMPGLAFYLEKRRINPELLSCSTLPATLTEVVDSACEMGLTSGSPYPFQLTKMDYLHAIYAQISKQYKNYSATSNIGNEKFGIGCMNNAAQILSGYFEDRLNSLDLLLERLSKMHSDYKEKLNPYLIDIENALVQLDGGKGLDNLKDRALTRDNNLLNFKDQFNSNSCNSLFEGNEINKQNGINGILNNIQDEFVKKNGDINGENYEQKHAQIEKEIDDFSREAADSFKSNYAEIDKNQIKFGKDDLNKSLVKTELNKDFFSNLQTSFKDEIKTLKEQEEQYKKKIPGLGNTIKLLGNPRQGLVFDGDLVKIERDLKNQCLNKAWGDMKENILKNIFDPTLSSHSKKFATNPYKEELKRILARDDITIDQKLAEIQRMEKTRFNSQYILTLNQSVRLSKLDKQGMIETNELTAKSMQPSTFFASLVKNCEAQFESKGVGEQFSQRQALEGWRDLNKKHLSLSGKYSTKIQETIKNRLLNCNNNDQVSNNISPGSCNSKRFDTTNANFCAKAALDCSRKMKDCKNTITARQNQLKEVVKTRSQSFNQIMSEFNNEFLNKFDEIFNSALLEGNALGALFNKELKMPDNIERNIWPTDGSSNGTANDNIYMKEFSSSQKSGSSEDFKLKLKNPDEFLRVFKKNIKSLRASVKSQQDEILGENGNGVLGEHIKKTASNYTDVIQGATELSNKCFEQFKVAGQYLAELEAQNKQQQSNMGENNKNFCKIIRLGMNGNPRPICAQLFPLFSSALLSAQTPEASEEVQKVEEYCAEHDNVPATASDICFLPEAKTAPTSPPPDTSSLYYLCEQMHKACEQTSVATATTNPPPSVPNCGYAQERVFSKYKMLPKTNKSNPNFPQAPAYCDGANDDNPFVDNLMEGMKIFNQQLNGARDS